MANVCPIGMVDLQAKLDAMLCNVNSLASFRQLEQTIYHYSEWFFIEFRGKRGKHPQAFSFSDMANKCHYLLDNGKVGYSEWSNLQRVIRIEVS